MTLTSTLGDVDRFISMKDGKVLSDKRTLSDLFIKSLTKHLVKGGWTYFSLKITVRSTSMYLNTFIDSVHGSLLPF